MKIEINISKKHFWIITTLLMISMVVAFSDSIPWHPLQQISGDNGITSVDSDSDGIIDTANASKSCDADGMCEAQNVNITGELSVGTGTTRINSTHVTSDYFEGNGSGLTSVSADWNSISNMPAGFSDGTDNTGGTFSCTVQSVTQVSNGITVTCPGGYYVTGGGYAIAGTSPEGSYPTSITSWYCYWSLGGGHTCYAMCCRQA